MSDPGVPNMPIEDPEGLPDVPDDPDTDSEVSDLPQADVPGVERGSEEQPEER